MASMRDSMPSISSGNTNELPLPAPVPGRKLRVAIITENFLPKVDGVTRTLCKLLEHLQAEGHSAIVLGPASSITYASSSVPSPSPSNILVDSLSTTPPPSASTPLISLPLSSYAGHPLVPTHGIPLQLLGVYGDGLRLNFFRPLFIRRLIEFEPDVIHFVDPIWLGAQMMPAVEAFLPDVPRVSSYHTNLATYASLYGFPWNLLTPTMWRLERYLHGRCTLTFVPSPSTASALVSEHGFPEGCLRIWTRGIDTARFGVGKRSALRRAQWGLIEEETEVRYDGRGGEALSVIEEEDESTELGLAERPTPLLRTRSFGSDTDSGYGGSPPFNGSFGERAFASFGEGVENMPLLLPDPLLPPPPSLSLSPLPPPSLPLPSFSPPFSPPSSHSAILPFPSGTSARTTRTTYPTVVLLYVGRLAWEKNLRLLLDAYRALPPAAADRAVLVFVGDGPARAELERMSAAYFGVNSVAGASSFAAVHAENNKGRDGEEAYGQMEEDNEKGGKRKRVVFEGHRSGAELAEMFASADVSVFPSYTETFGQVVLEALASGLPVVGLKAEGVKDLVEPGKTGLLLDLDALSTSLYDTSSASTSSTSPTPTPPHILLSPASATSSSAVTTYSTLLASLILSPSLRLSMSRSAVLKAQTYSWSSAMGAIVRGYHEAVDAHVDGANRESLDERSVLKGHGPWSTKRGSRRWSLPLVWVVSRMGPEGVRGATVKAAKVLSSSLPAGIRGRMISATTATTGTSEHGRIATLRSRFTSRWGPATSTASTVSTEKALLGSPRERMEMDEEAQRAVLRTDGQRAFLSVARRYGASSMQARLVILAFLMYSLATWSFLIIWPFPGVLIGAGAFADS